MEWATEAHAIRVENMLAISFSAVSIYMRLGFWYCEIRV